MTYALSLGNLLLLGRLVSPQAATVFSKAVACCMFPTVPFQACVAMSFIRRGMGFALTPGQAFGPGLLALGTWGTALVLTRHPLFDEITKTVPAFRRSVLRPAE